MAEMPNTSEERRRRVRETIRLAARYVDQKGRGRPVQWGSAVRITRLDADGNPTGPPANIGPIIFSTSFQNVDDDLVRKMFGE
jgi:hypothetical protein